MIDKIQKNTNFIISHKNKKRPVIKSKLDFILGMLLTSLVFILAITAIGKYISTVNKDTRNVNANSLIPQKVEDNSITNIVKAVTPGIVTVLTGDSFYNLLGNGSGVVYKNSNNKVYILTNAHVVEDASIVEVYRNDLGISSSETASVLAKDRLGDVAVLEINSPENTYPISISFANTDNLLVGEKVIAIGSPYVSKLGPSFSGSVTEGIISGLNREIPKNDKWFRGKDPNNVKKYIQTDAAINGGNSGGPLLDMNGNLVGLNSAKVSSAENINLALCSDYVYEIMKKLGVELPNVS